MPEREGLHPSGYLGCGSIGFRSSASRIREDSEDQGQGAGRATATKRCRERRRRTRLAGDVILDLAVGREADLRATGTAPRGDESREKKKEDIFFIFFQRPGEEEKRESSRNRSAMWTI